jgi:glycosyltransferase involved in cell wall biosynthesis
MESPPRVLLLTDADVLAGTERHILALACALKNQQVDVRVGCPVPSPLAEAAQIAGVGVVAIPKRGRIDWRAARQLRRLVKGGQVQILHAHNGRTALAAAIALRGLSRARLVLTQHFLDPAQTQRRGPAALAGGLVHRWIDGRIDQVIAISNAVAEAMHRRQKVCENRITIIHNGLAQPDRAQLRPADHVRAELGAVAQSPLIVCAARLEAEKEIDTLILAMHKVRDDLPTARCVVAGEGSLRQRLQSQIDELGLQSQVRLLGFRSDVLSLMNAGDLFVLPSRAEPFGLVLLEAMSLSKPVVATCLAGPAEIVEDGVTGLLVPPSDPAALGEAIHRLLDDPPAAREMGRQGLRRFQTHFTDQQMAAATAVVYRELLA